MNISLTKKTILFILTILWIGFSVIYIGLDVWNDFKAHQISRAFESGRAEAIREIIRQTTGERCEPVVLFSEGTEVRLINVDCLEKER